LKLTEEVLEIATDYQLPLYEGVSSVFNGWVRFFAGERKTGLERIMHGLETLHAIDMVAFLPQGYAILTEYKLRDGKYDDAVEAADRGLDAVRMQGFSPFEAELHRLRGESIALSGGEITQAAEALDRALEVARMQSAKSLELRAAMSRVRIQQSRAKREQALGLLKTTYDWFTEGFETADLKQAKVLIDGTA
jgi:hypothetical protein